MSTKSNPSSSTNAPEPYYSDGLVTLYCGRCEDILPTLGPVDLVVTSPPYNMGLVPGGNGRGMYRPGASNKAGRFRDGYGAHDDAMPQDEYDAWQRRVIALCMDVLTPRGALFYNHRPRTEHGEVRFPLGLDFGFPITKIITWDRGTGIDVNLRNYCSVYEWIIVLGKPEFRLVDHAASGMGDVWRLGMARVPEHPAPFPVSLPERALVTTGAASVLDPFAGSGTTLVAAKSLGRRAIGIELEERFCALAVSRLAQGSLMEAAA